MFVSQAWAQEGVPGGGGIFEFLFPLVLIFAIFYFLLIRPQQKRQKEHQSKLNAVRRGDKVILGGGIFGKVTKVDDDDTIQVEIADGITVKSAKTTLMDVMTKGEPAKDSKKPANDGGSEEKKSLIGTLFGGGGKKDGDKK